MKIFKVNQESINKGIINKYFGFDIVTTELVAEVIKRTNLIKIDKTYSVIKFFKSQLIIL